MTSVRDVRVDADGVRIVRQEGARRVVVAGVGLIALIVVATVVAVLLLEGRSVVHRTPPAHRLGVSGPAGAVPAPGAAASPVATATAAPMAKRDVHPRRKRSERKAAAAAERAEESLDARDVIPALQAAGEREGIAAFPVPGTDPPKAGLIVPDDFTLPEGYVRHFQATDDGQRLPAILMFHPDYEFVDAAGTPIALPADGVVPPDLAPPGMPLETLELPDRKP